MLHSAGNPWLTLPSSPPYVAKGDSEVVKIYNRSGPAEARLLTEMLPVPFLGDPAAPIVLLSDCPIGNLFEPEIEKKINFKRVYWRCLTHEKTDVPFFVLD